MNHRGYCLTASPSVFHLSIRIVCTQSYHPAQQRRSIHTGLSYRINIDANQISKSIVHRTPCIARTEVSRAILRVILPVFQCHVSTVWDWVSQRTVVALADLLPQACCCGGRLPSGLRCVRLHALDIAVGRLRYLYHMR